MTDFLSYTLKKDETDSTGTYELKIENYSQYPKTFGNNKIESPVFKLMNREWKLVIYPGGKSESHQGYISIFLHNSQVDSDVIASSIFILVNQIRINASVRSANKEKDLFRKKCSRDLGWGIGRLVKQSLLDDKNSPYIVNDTVIFRVEIGMSGKCSQVDTVSKSGPSVNSALNAMLESGFGSDVSVVVVNGDNIALDPIPAHKCILMARSPVFKAMFTHSMSESNTNEIMISDFSPEVVREMLHFMYTDKLQSETLDNTMYEGLLGAAIKYDVSALIHLCERHFSAEMSHNNVLEIYTMADRCGSTELTAQATAYIKKHSVELLERTDFQPMLDNFLSAAVLRKAKKV